MVKWLKKLGNALKLLYGQCISPQSQTTDDQELGHHGVSSSTVAVSALAQHLYHYESTHQVPEGLSNYVPSKKAQSNSYRKLSKAWMESKPQPNTPEEASRLIIHVLRRHHILDVEGLLSFYGLPLPHSLDEFPTGEDETNFELNTLTVIEKSVPDGDGVNVLVSTSDPRESSLVPQYVQMAAFERNKARAERNYTKADALRKQIIDAGYLVICINNEEILARKYRIRLRGIDAPENDQPYGKEAKEELVKILKGERLKIRVFDKDKYGRFVGDVYCNGIFVQKRMLKKGLAWHYKFHDKRPQLAKLERFARDNNLGLWASPNPEEPWNWRRKNYREQRY